MSLVPLTPLLIADGPGVSGSSVPPQWGLYLNGKPAIIADSIIGFEFLKEWRVSNSPQEQGAFESYNKVATPFGAKMTMTKSGTDAVKGAFLAALDAACASLTLYTAVTPEISYPSVNPSHYDYRRTSRNGATLLTIDLWLIQVRVTVVASFTNTQSPSGASPVSGGQVQPAAPPPALAGGGSASSLGFT